ncbi:MAG: GH36-type glycosyl hydrolase domain-containing protein [Planctomycetota bacterium]
MYGSFDDAAREFVITDPRTPWPWINYLGSDRFFGIISNTGGGYCWYRDPALRRLTRYRYNNVPIDDGGRYYYIRDGETIWNPGWKPCRTPVQDYRCRHGLGYTVLQAAHAGIVAELTCTVPPEDPCELHLLRLRNDGDTVKDLQVFGLVEWCLWNAVDDAANFQRNFSTGEVSVQDSTIYHCTEYRERRNHYAFLHCNRTIDGFDTDRESFIGLYDGFDAPQAVRQGRCTGSIAAGWSPIAAQQLNCRLEPGASWEVVFILGYGDNPTAGKWTTDGAMRVDAAQRLIARYADADAVRVALAATAERWERLFASCRISSGDARLDRMVNCWNPYQCMVTFNCSRSASGFESGTGRGMGFRDSSQDLLGFVHQIPERARQRILDIAATQLRDGGALHQYQPLTKRGNSAIGDGFNDDPLWLILGTCAYIRETGDSAILDEVVDFENDPALAAPLREHLWRSFRYTLEHRGPHDLPLIGRADWNDCLNLNCFSQDPDESFQTTGQRAGAVAESLMIAGLFCAAGEEFSALLEHLGEDVDAARAGVDDMRRAIDQHGRDEAWFLRAYDAAGEPVGASSNTHGQLFIESQGWCIMGGCGLADGFAARALASVEERLGTEHGIVLQQPPFPRYDERLGEISSYPPGFKENAGIFCHNNPWITIAQTLVGDAEAAWRSYTRINPAWITDQRRHRTEPYVYSQMIAGRDAGDRHGEAKNSWLTGTAAWNYVAITQHLLGIRPEHAGLRLRPCLPRHLGRIQVTRQCRGSRFDITLEPATPDAPAGVRVDDRPVQDGLIPWPARGSQVHAVCYY